MAESKDIELSDTPDSTGSTDEGGGRDSLTASADGIGSKGERGSGGGSPSLSSSDYLIGHRRPSIRPKHVFVVQKTLPWRLVRDEARELQVIRGMDYDDPVIAAANRLSEQGTYTFTWVGGISNPGDVSKEEWATLTPLLKQEYNAIPVITDQPLWTTFCKLCLWPLLNSQSVTRSFRPVEWRAYKAANRTYAEALAGLLTPLSETADMIWIHNYHLLLYLFLSLSLSRLSNIVLLW